MESFFKLKVEIVMNKFKFQTPEFKPHLKPYNLIFFYSNLLM